MGTASEFGTVEGGEKDCHHFYLHWGGKEPLLGGRKGMLTGKKGEK